MCVDVDLQISVEMFTQTGLILHREIFCKFLTITGGYFLAAVGVCGAQKEVEAQRTALQKKKKSKEDEILEFTNQLSKLQDFLEETHKATIQAQDEIDSSMEHKCNTTKTIGQIRMATQNLYDRCMEVSRSHKKVCPSATRCGTGQNCRSSTNAPNR